MSQFTSRSPRSAALVLAAIAAGVLLLVALRRSGSRSPGPGGASEIPESGRSPDDVGTRRSGGAGAIAPPRLIVPSPEPRERRYEAYRAKEEARRSGRWLKPSELFEHEARDPVWAEAMEAALGRRLERASALLAKYGLWEMQLTDVECRQSTCRMMANYTDRALERAKAAGQFGPRDTVHTFLVHETGPFSQSSFDEGPEPFKVEDGVTHFQSPVYMVFSEQESDPDKYDDWVEGRHRSWVANEKNAMRLAAPPH
jgi:hypothetical protein